MPEMTNGAARAAAGLCRAAMRAYARKGPFLGAFALALGLSFIVLSTLGLTPDPIKANVQTASASVILASAVSPAAPELPVKIAIPAISLSVAVTDPTTTDTSVLDAA